MKAIDVDLDVYAAIWTLRKKGELTENDVLRRMLLPLAEACHEHTASKEVFTSISSQNDLIPNAMEKQTMRYVSGKVRWIDDIVSAFQSLGGQAHLAAIYNEVEQIRRAAGRSIPSSLEATIRRTIEDHSSDSDNFRGEDVFEKIGRGEWALR